MAHNTATSIEEQVKEDVAKGLYSAAVGKSIIAVATGGVNTFDEGGSFGAPTATTAPAEAFAGIFEGGTDEFYGTGLFYLVTFVFAILGVVVYVRFVINSEKS